jgi:hypothetical protein
VTFLLDTDVVSEWTRPRPAPSVVRWLDEVDEDRVHLSVITLGELRDGVDRLPPGRRRSALDRWLRDDLPDRFAGRSHRAGRRRFLGATASVHGLTVVTRNIRDFTTMDVPVLDPWLPG